MATLFDIAKLVEGTLVGISTSAAEKTNIVDAFPLTDATPHSITLLDNAANADSLVQSAATAAIVPAAQLDEILKSIKSSTLILIAVDHPHQAFEKAIEYLRPANNRLFTGIHPTAVLGDNVQLGRDVCIGPYVTVDANCTIGDRTVLHAGTRVMAHCSVGRDCELFPNTVLYPKTVLEDRVVLHSGTVLGAYGFGYKQVQGRHNRTAQLGWVHLESDVEVGANTTIDRGTYGATRIATGTKIDNLVQIGHNVKVGPHNLICSQVGIAGSSSTGSYVVLGGQVGIRDHIHLGDRCMAGAQSGIAADVPADEVVVGAPAAPRKEALQSMLAIQRLPEMRKQLRQMQNDIQRLLQSAGSDSISDNDASASQSRAA